MLFCLKWKAFGKSNLLILYLLEKSLLLDDLPIENVDLPEPASPEGATIQLVDLEYQVAALISYVFMCNVGKTIINHPPNHHFYRWYGGLISYIVALIEVTLG
jgi:hypothetical protein